MAGRLISARGGRTRRPAAPGPRGRVLSALAAARAAGRRPAAREALVFAAFVGLTTLMTWPWALCLRDAVADKGDPYMIAWSLWWDYHQTFNDPLRLFHANVFYPYQYTLAFSENDYGIALLFFPLFAAGVRPLTVNSLATFLGFAFCGYAAFRLTRTLTGSNVAAWAGGIFFAFVPYRFGLLSHLHYLFAGWMPLVLDALVLYARRRTWRRAAWLGAAFLMNALSCISWFIMSLVPLALTGLYLLARRPALLRERAFWVRGVVALGAAGLMLVPFLLPYLWVSEMYGLRWPPGDFYHFSPSAVSWLAGEPRTKLWSTFGRHLPEAHRMFPGLLAPLLALAALRFAGGGREEPAGSGPRRGPGRGLEVAALAAALVGVFAVGYPGFTLRLFGVQLLRAGDETPGHALVVVAVALGLRLSLELRGLAGRLREGRAFAGVRRRWRDEAVAVGLIWAAWGFFSSLGVHFFLNRWLREHFFLFQSLRVQTRWAMICYVGLAVLAGAGAARLASMAARSAAGTRLRRPAAIVCALVCAALLFDLRAFPLHFERGEADPDALALRLKETPMRGGLVELPTDVGVVRHRYMLRSADHGRPLVNATASFVSPLVNDVHQATAPGKLGREFLDLLEGIPASYLVVHNQDLPPERAAEYEDFLVRAVVSGRLRFVNRFDGRSDLYAVTAVEPGAREEAPPPFAGRVRDWSSLVAEEPVNMLGAYTGWSARLLRLHLAATGRLPRYPEFLSDLGRLGRGVVPGFDEHDRRLEANFRELAAEVAGRPAARAAHEGSGEAEFVGGAYANAGLRPEAAEREALARALASGEETRAGLLARVASDDRLGPDERRRTLVALHFYGYLRRAPDDPPNHNLDGLLHWVQQLERGLDPGDLHAVFENSLERNAIKGR